MSKLRFFLVLAALLALVAAGCGGPGTVPSNAVAVVGDVTITKEQFDVLLEQAKRSYKSQRRPFPKAGSPEYEQLKRQAMQFLVQRAEFEQKAEDLGVEVTDKQVEDRLTQIKKQYFGGDEKKYEAQLSAQGLTDKQVRSDIKAQLVSEAIFKKVTADVKVSDQEIESYFNKNRQQYQQPESRDIRHILVKTKAQANRLYDRIKAGEDFAALAKKFSQDPGSKSQGGKLTISRGQTVAPFDQTAFLLPKGGLSRPVKTQYGYHLIRPISDVRPAKTTPLGQVKEAIRQQLLQTRKNEAMTRWVDEAQEDFCDGKLNYQVGYKPNPDPCKKTETATAER